MNVINAQEDVAKKQPIEAEMKIVPESLTAYQVTDLCPTVDTIARQMLRNKQSAESELWPVIDNNVNKNVQQPQEPLREAIQASLFAQAPVTSDVDRLKVATLIALLADETAKRFATEKQIVFLTPQTVFDFQTLSKTPRLLSREITVLKNRAQKQLINVFESIISRLLAGFEEETRYDRLVLQFVAHFNDFVTNFTFTEQQALLARQYVYSALYDGQLLQFDEPVEILQIDDNQGIESSESTSDKLNGTTVEHILMDVDRKTTQIFQQHKILNKLIADCTEMSNENCAEAIKQTIAQMCKLVDKPKNLCNLFKVPSLQYETVKNVEKITRLCCVALTNKFIVETKMLQQIANCGFFDDPIVLGSILDSGCLQFLSKRSARLFLLEKLSQHVPQILQSPAGKENESKEIFQAQRILWLVYVTSTPATRQELKKIQVDDSKNLQKQTEYSIEILKQIYKLLRTTETANIIAARHKTIHNFLLRHKQYYLALAAQKEFTSIFQK